MTIAATTLQAFAALVGDEHVITDPVQLDNNSRDCYWYSPVLKPQLDAKVGEVIVRPGTVAELIEVIKVAFREQVPITLRGAATGN